MKRFIFVSILLFSLILSACGRNYDQVVKGEENKDEAPESELGLTTYVVNTSTYSYHMPTCRIVPEIKDENKVETRDIDFLVEHNYKPCGICIGNK